MDVHPGFHIFSLEVITKCPIVVSPSKFRVYIYGLGVIRDGLVVLAFLVIDNLPISDSPNFLHMNTMRSKLLSLTIDS